MTLSTMLELGTGAPDFQLSDVVSGETISLATFADKKGLLVMFICRHCPYVKHIEKELARLGQDYANADLGIIAVSSNDAEEYPDDAPDQLKAMAQELGFMFPFCHDESQDAAKAYSAACTPDFFLFGSDRELVYRGQLDDSRPENDQPVDGHHLRAALEAALNDQPVRIDQKPSVGCNIKWRAGNEPDYYSAA